MSVLGKKWIQNKGKLSDLLTQDLDNESVMFHDPFLMPNMHRAIDRIKAALNNKERIVVFGDYDVDGVSATAILINVLRELGGEVSYRLPDRQDGYGLNVAWISELKEKKVDLLITVDCGISNRAEIEEGLTLLLPIITLSRKTCLMLTLFCTLPLKNLTTLFLIFPEPASRLS